MCVYVLHTYIHFRTSIYTTERQSSVHISCLNPGVWCSWHLQLFPVWHSTLQSSALCAILLGAKRKYCKAKSHRNAEQITMQYLASRDNVYSRYTKRKSLTLSPYTKRKSLTVFHCLPPQHAPPRKVGDPRIRLPKPKDSVALHGVFVNAQPLGPTISELRASSGGPMPCIVT